MFASGDVGTNRDIHVGLAVRPHKWGDGRQQPIQAPIFGAVAHLLLPGPTAGNGVVHRLEKCLGMGAGVEHAVVLPQQLFAGVAADFAKPVVDRENAPLHIGGRHDGMLVQRGQCVFELRAEGGFTARQGQGHVVAGLGCGCQCHADQRKNQGEKPVPGHVGERHAVAKKARALRDARGPHQGDQQQHQGGPALAQAQGRPRDEQEHPVPLRHFVEREVGGHRQQAVAPFQKHHAACQRGQGKNQGCLCDLSNRWPGVRLTERRPPHQNQGGYHPHTKRIAHPPGEHAGEEVIRTDHPAQQQARGADAGTEGCRCNAAPKEHARNIAQGRQAVVKFAIAMDQPGPHACGQCAAQGRPGGTPPHRACQQAFDQRAQEDRPEIAFTPDQQGGQSQPAGQVKDAGAPVDRKIGVAHEGDQDIQRGHAEHAQYFNRGCG